MTDKPVLQWIAVNGLIDDVFREKVIADALNHLPNASADLRKYALGVFKKDIHVNGFRTFYSIPTNIAKTHVLTEFKKSNDVTEAIICLWAEKHPTIIDALINEALDAKIPVHKNWNWNSARKGFINFEDIPELNALATEIAEKHQKPESDQYLLGALWLSQSLIMEEPKELTVEMENESSELSTAVKAHQMNNPVVENKQIGSENGKVKKENQDIPTNEPSLDVADLDRKTINDLSQYWESQSSEILGARDSFLAKIDELRAAALTDKPDQAMEKLKLIKVERQEWDSLQKQSEELVDYIQSRVTAELQLRPDIKDVQPEVAVLSEIPGESELVAILPTIFQAITNYDARKSALLAKIDDLRKELLILEQSLSHWQNDISPIQYQLQQINDLQDHTVQQLQVAFDDIRLVTSEGNDRRLQARQISVNRILDTATKVTEISNGEKIQIDGQDLLQLTEISLQEMPGKRLQVIEQEILIKFNQLVTKKKSGDSQKLVSQLRASWNNEVLLQLLENLAKENKNLEAVLIEMASSIAHPRTTHSIYSREIADSLFSGVSELSTDTNPYVLLSQLASPFFLGWASEDSVTRYQKCILALAAHSVKESGLPEGFLWQLEIDWPEPSLENWGRLWQSVLLEEDIQIFTDQKIAEIQADLDEKKRNVDILFTKDGGHYMRLSSIKSDRHRHMMTKHVMPQLQRQYDDVNKLRDEFESAVNEKQFSLFGKLEKTLDRLNSDLAEKNLDELYQKGIYTEKIVDRQPFHTKICLRVISETATAILEYCKEFLELETLRKVRKDGHNYQNLAKEIDKQTSINPLIHPALDQITKGSLKASPERNEEMKVAHGIQKVIAKLLSHADYTHRFPHTICLLVNKPFSWESFLESLLVDMESTKDIVSAAKLLLDENATGQVLQVVQQIPLDLQKLAQSTHRDHEKKINDLESEYLKLGGENEWIKLNYDLGRWGYLSERIKEEISKLKKEAEKEHQAFELQSFSFRERINKLDMEIFKARTSISIEVFKVIQNGLSISRKASEVSQLFPQLKEYLNEIEYRLSRESWIETEVESATQELEKHLSGTRIEKNIQNDAEDILRIFNAGELARLGLDPNEIEDSKITTRVNVLDNWVSVKSINTFLSNKLSKIEINNIKSLFSHFARMNQMQRSIGIDGNPMSYENPIVHEYWTLRFPRTPALSKDCVMVALSGDPPSSKDLQFLDEFLENEKFLDAHFVFLFIPGCTSKIAKRLSQNYSKQGLVIIDEQALLKMILAERESSMIPLGKLRPIMLNSTGANADIFTVNQSVNSRTSIFYGRDTLIERIASSGDNYAVYGGRRIGKSSILKGLEQLLDFRKFRVISYSFEGDIEYTEEFVSKRIAELFGIMDEYEKNKDIKSSLQDYFESNPTEKVVLILDEIDRYISENRERHAFIETLRATSDRFEDRFRIIIAGFMELYDCLSGRGPYTPTSDPWGRMLNNIGPVENLKTSNAEKIVQEGFLSILGWNFEHRAIPRRIVERTGGHPAFVQYFCLKLQEQVSKRGDQLVTLKDIDTVFDDNSPEKSFIWFVRKTLEMNLSDPAYMRTSNEDNISDPVSRYLLLWLALDSSDSKTFTLDQIKEIASFSNVHIPEKILMRSLELLTVTSVVREKASQLYEFTVPDYPLILNRLGEGAHLDALEKELKKFLEGIELNGQA